MAEEKKKENIWNLPNILTFSRIIIAFLTIFLIFAEVNILYVVLTFLLGMLTDTLDGQIARRFNLKTEFGRQFDMIADRFLMVGVALAVIVKLGISEVLTTNQLFQIFFILSREIILSPIVLVALISGKGVPIPQVRFIGKLTTVMQAITFPAILLGIFFDFFSFSIYLAVATGVVGLVSAFCYVNDIKKIIG